MWFQYAKQTVCCKITNTLKIIVYELLEIIMGFKKLNRRQIIYKKAGGNKSIFQLAWGVFSRKKKDSPSLSP